MLTKRKVRVFVFFLLVAMVFSSVLNFNTPTNTAKAEDSVPSVSIKTNNVSYSDSIYILYAVTHSGFESNKNQIKMLFWNSLQDEYTVDNALYIEKSRGSKTIGGEKCEIFYSQGLAAKSMTEDIYARAYVVVDGTEYYSEVMKFSVLEYVHSMLERDKDEDESNNLSNKQRKLLQQLLEYGGAAQDNFDHNTDRKANDEYFKLQIKGGKLPDGFKNGRYKKGDKFKVVADEPKEGKRFSHWIDKHGNIVGTDVELEVEIGEEDLHYEAVYKDINDLGTTVNLFAEVDYDGTVEEIGLPQTVSFVYDEQTVTLDVTWNTEFFVEKQIGTQVLVATLVDQTAYETYDIQEGGITIEITTLAYSLEIDSKTNCYAVTGYFGGEEDVLLPASFKGITVNAIGKNAFDDNDTLVEITIPNTYVKIGDYAFRNCDALSKINGGEAVQTIGNYSFHNCDSLVEIEIGKCVTRVDDYAFYNCYNLENVICNDNLTSIGGSAFYNCYKLTTIKLGSNLTGIGNSAFYNCVALDGVVIPDGVKAIYSNTFYGCSSLSEIVIPDSVTNIGWSAFEDCSSLKSAKIGNNVTNIGSNAFERCVLLTSITLPDSLLTLESRAFAGCANLQTVVLGKNVTKIEGSTFDDCASLESINLPDSITSIGGYAFSNCSSIKSIEIPASVSSIGGSAFNGCTNLVTVKLAGSITNIYDFAFYNCTSLINIEIPSSVKNIGVSAFYNCSSLKSVKIPSGLTTIQNEVFAYCKALANVEIPASVTSIGGGAFYECSSLTSVEIPASVSNIGASAFLGCKGLTEITIPEGVESIGARAFDNCTSLVKLSIPDSLITIGGGLFGGCDKLIFNELGDVKYLGNENNKYIYLISASGAFVEVEPTCKFIDDYAFNHTSSSNYSLSNVIIPESVTYIGDYAFRYCKSLSSIYIPESVSVIGGGAFSECSSITIFCQAQEKPSGWDSDWNANSYPVVWGCDVDETSSVLYAISSDGTYVEVAGIAESLQHVEIAETYKNLPVKAIRKSAFDSYENLNSVILPDGLTTIGENAFMSSGLTSIEIPASVTSIGSGAFFSCASLQTVSFGEGSELTSIENNTFSFCESLTGVQIPANVTSIESGAFHGCESLQTVIFEEESELQSIGEEAFYGCALLTSVKIPNGVTSIGLGAFKGCNGLTEMSLPFVGATLGGTTNTHIGYIFGTVDYSYNKENVPNTLTKVVISGSDIIRSYAFYGCASVVNIEIPASVTSIGMYAFSGCTSLQTVTFEQGSMLESIGHSAFSNCSSLTSIEIPYGVTSISDYAFAYCDSLTSIEIPDSIISIGVYVFNGCDNLPYKEENGLVYLGNKENEYLYLLGVTSKEITKAEINGKCKIIGGCVFLNCHLLVNVVIPDSVIMIGDHAFYNCSFESIIIPDSVTNIGERAFDNNTALETIYCEAESKPSGWATLNSYATVVWGYKG